jgi:hypothetical protein
MKKYLAVSKLAVVEKILFGSLETCGGYTVKFNNV